jgi:ABC-2 type transport system permease protein
MMPVLLIAKRDFAAYLRSYYGWIIIAALLFITGVLFYFAGLGAKAQLSTEVLGWFFYFTGGTTIAASVFLSMRALAEERDNRTEMVLHTSPVADWQIVVGKYLAVMGVLSVYFLLTAHMPLLVVVNGKIAWGQVMTGYIGLFCLGSAAVSIGIFASALARVPWGAQVLALVISAVMVVTAVLFFWISIASEAPFAVLAEHMALWNKHFEPFKEGRLETYHVIYYVSTTWLFLMLATRLVERRRWQ